MSVDANYFGNAQRLVCQNLSGTATTKIGATADDSSLVLAGIWLCNASGSSITATVYWYDSATSTEHMIWRGDVADKVTVGGSFSTLPGPISLRNGDEIRVSGNTNLHVTLLYVMILNTGR